MLPVARVAGAPAPPMVAFFTSVSAICVTGLVVVDTGSYWSGFGQSTILLLFQLGGFGMMTAATLLGLMVNRSPRLGTLLVTQKETRSLWVGDISSVARLVQADSMNESVMLQLGVADFSHAIVAIGPDLAASLMTLMVLTELGLKDIWVKAMTPEHGQIATRIGAHHVVYPEVDMGARVAHQITGRMMDFIEFETSGTPGRKPASCRPTC